jgi:hypothetical protein
MVVSYGAGLTVNDTTTAAGTGCSVSSVVSCWNFSNICCHQEGCRLCFPSVFLLYLWEEEKPKIFVVSPEHSTCGGSVCISSKSKEIPIVMYLFPLVNVVRLIIN